MWRHVAFDDDHGEPHRGFIISIDSHPDEPTVDVECADAVWKHVPADRMRPDPQPPTFRPEPKKGDGPTARLYGWLASRAAAWMTTVIADGSIQEALDANEPDPEYRADWIPARHAFAQACETGDIRAVRDALAGVREHATRDHVLEWTMGASYGKAAWSSPLSESWELIELLESTLIVLDPRPGDRRPHVSIAPWLSWEDGQRAGRALDHPSARTVHADGSPDPLQDTPDLRLRRMIIPATRDLLARNADHLILHIHRSRKTIGPQTVASTKTEHSVRDENIPPQYAPYLDRLLQQAGPEPDAWLFPSTRDVIKPIRPNSLRSWYDEARKAAGRPDLRFHDLRHTALTLLAQQGATVRELMDAAGHADPQTAMRYQHSVSGRAQDLAKRIGSLIPHPTPSKPSDNASKPTTTKSNDSRRRTGNSNSASPRSPIRTAYRRCNRRNTNALELHMIKSSPGARR